MSKKKEWNFIDLFAGCGGLSEGFYMQGFNALAHVEIDHYACETLKTRMKHYGYQDVEKAVLELDITREDAIEKISDVVNGQEIDLIIGGPPCQSFSTLGVAKDENNMENDPRNYLFESYIKVLNYFTPKFFVFENVTGILKAKVKGKSIIDTIFERLGENYKITTNLQRMVLDATNYGVPQDRIRVIIIGVKKNLNITPEEVYDGIVKTHYSPGMAEDEIKGLKKFVTVRDAIGDLPFLKAGDGKAIVDHKIDVANSNDFIKKMRKEDETTLSYHVARKHNEMDIKRYVVMAENKWSFLQLLDNRPDLGHEKRRVFFNSYKVQWWDKPSKTIIAHLYKDGNQFIHPDYNQGRTFTVREAARIQSFPDNFVIEGSRTEQYKQIGNAVPPLLAEAIAKSIKGKLEQCKKENKSAF